jgi:Domain of unknown function (DUF1844)
VADEAPIDFATFIISMNHSALIELGVAPDPDTQKVEVHIDQARHTIDLLAMLEEKTKGNLSGDEERLLHQVLYDLRMRCVEAEKRVAAKAGK